jgi:1-acyl-sn-glycerol-3-phosphate acyltransferase
MTSSIAPRPLDPDADGHVLAQTLALVKELTAELHPQMPRIDALDADASLERDCGLDSLARVELAVRLERALSARPSDAALAESETVRDLAHALLGIEATSAVPCPEPVRPVSVAAVPRSATTLLESLEWHAARQPERTHVLLLEHEASPQALTFGALREAAAAVATGLMRRGIRPGEAVAIMLPTGREFFAAFYGALYARAIPVPLYPPARPSQIETHLKRVAGILENCEARMLLTFDAARRLGHLLKQLKTRLEWIATVPETVAPVEASFAAPPVRAEEIAFLQYTSGSTGQPKGVVLTHANLLANLNAMQRATGITAADSFVSWLPLYHDMGLIGACLGALAFGFPLVLMSPLAFLSHPVRWLRAIDHHRATITAAPNFAYEVCAYKIGERDLAGLDLSTLRFVFSGAEAVSANTLEHFAERFAPFGLRRAALMPVFGLAECALGLTFPPPGRGPRVDCLERAALLESGLAHVAPSPGPTSLQVVSCGLPLPGHAVRIVDRHGRPLAERMQGRIEFQGPSATSGYFNNPRESAQLYHDRWLDTGDLGYLAGGELYVTGRAKDIIIRGGHNIHPQELEEAIAQLPEVRKGGVVVFPATDRRSGTERVVALVETLEPQAAQRDALSARINHLALDLIGMPIDDIVLAPARTILKTSSGKIRRAACREAYEHGTLGVRAPWVQLLRLALQGLRVQAGLRARRLAELLWGVRALIVALALAPLLWLAVVLTPGLPRRRRIVTRFMRFAARLAGIGVRSLGPAPHGTCVYVANHASYLDALVLLAVLPSEVAFVAKRELEHSLTLGLLLRRLGCLFVERRAVHRALSSAAELDASLNARHSLVLFPEGTFEREPGLLPFHMGAFRAAAASGATMIPVTLCGTRRMLPCGALLPRPGPLEVILGEPLAAEDSSWQSAVKLRRASRAQILARLGEPDLESRPAAA